MKQQSVWAYLLLWVASDWDGQPSSRDGEDVAAAEIQRSLLAGLVNAAVAVGSVSAAPLILR